MPAKVHAQTTAKEQITSDTNDSVRGVCTRGGETNEEMSFMPDFMEKQASVDDVLREITRLKEMVSDGVEDGVRTALRAIKQGRGAADDAIHDARRAVRQNPIQSMGLVFASGVMLGAFAAWMGSRRG